MNENKTLIKNLVDSLNTSYCAINKTFMFYPLRFY